MLSPLGSELVLSVLSDVFHCTLSVAWTVCCSEAAEPVTVIVYVPGGVPVGAGEELPHAVWNAIANRSRQAAGKT